MKLVVNFFRSTWTEHQALQWIANVMVTTHVALGVAVLVGGKQRFAYPTYQPLIDLTGGQTWIWGVWILGAAALMMIPARWPQIIGLWAAMVWQVMWCALFSVAVIHYPTAGVATAVMSGGLALVDAALLTARIVEHDGG